jgi:hypothetical protein
MSESKVVGFSRYVLQCKAPKREVRLLLQKKIAPARAYCDETHPSPCWKNGKEDSEVLELFLVLE